MPNLFAWKKKLCWIHIWLCYQSRVILFSNQLNALWLQKTALAKGLRLNWLLKGFNSDTFLAQTLSQCQQYITGSLIACNCGGIHHRAGWAGITNLVDHVSSGGTPGSTVLCELTRDFHSVLSPSCVAEDSRSRERFQVCLDRGCETVWTEECP